MIIHYRKKIIKNNNHKMTNEKFEKQNLSL